MVDWLATLAQAKAELKAQSNDDADDAWIVQNLPLISTRIMNLTRTRFVPYVKLEYFDAFGTHIDDVQRKLDLNRAIMLPFAVLDAFNNQLVYNQDYVTTPQDTPYFQLQLISALVYGWSYGFGFGTYFWIAPGQFLRKIQVAGLWGYRWNFPDDGWTYTGQVLPNGGILSTDTTFSVSSLSGPDANGVSPAISIGTTLLLGYNTQTINTSITTLNQQQMLNITSTNFEIVRVIQIAGTQLTVVRGQNGTTAKAWPAGTQLYSWTVQPEVQRATVRSIAYWYSRRGEFEAVKNDLANGRTLVYPEDLPAEVLQIRDQTRDWRWGAV